MYEIKLYYATVIDNDDQNHDDGKKKGRVQVRILPEMEGAREEHLPWARPFLNIGMSSSQFNYVSPEIDDKIWVLFIDNYFKNGYYLTGSFIDGFFDYSTITNALGNITESIDTTYPNLKFYYMPDGSIYFYNSDTGDKGIYHSNGSYDISTSDGQRYIYTKDQEFKIYNDSGTIECKSNGQIDINNGNLTVDV